VDKIGEPQKPKDFAPKVVDKQEIKAQSTASAAPEPEVKPKQPQDKPDQIAEALKKEQKKPEPKPTKPQPKLEFGKIENKLALLDKRDPQRQSVSGATLNSMTSLGTDSGTAKELSENEWAVLQEKLIGCWGQQLPPNVFYDAAHFAKFDVIVHFNRDGSLAAEPVATNLDRGSDSRHRIATESAVRAIQTCAPYRFMPVAKYEAWKDATLAFDTRIFEDRQPTKYATRRD
jgi:colicin import membrane protein